MTSDPRRALLDRYGAPLLRYARALAQDAELARDLWQETAVRALGAADWPAAAPAQRVWLFRILRNAFLDMRRRLRPEGDIEEADAPDSGTPWRHDAALVAEIAVREALARLPEAQRDVVALVDIAGFSYAEAAQTLGVPSGTVMSRLARARAAMLADIAGGSVVVPLPTRAGRRRAGS